MKTKILIFFAFYLVSISNFCNQTAFGNSFSNGDETISITCSPDLYTITSVWVKEYSKTNPNAKIKLSILSDSQTDGGDLSFTSNEHYTSKIDGKTWTMVVGMDAVVPVINSKNPFLEEINQQGVSLDKISQFVKNPEMQNWGTLLKDQKTPSKLYIANGELISLDIAKYLNIDPKAITAINLNSEEELISAIQNDPYAIGFCKVSSILNADNQNIESGLKLLPIDKNGNGRIDYNERIYDDLNAFLRGVWIGKYPKDLCKNIYSLSSTKPTKESEVEFLAWVLVNGQQYLNSNGFSDLASNQRQANLDKLYEKQIIVKSSSNNRAALPIVILIIVGCMVVFIMADYLIQRLRKKSKTTNAPIESKPFFNESSIKVPDGLYFDKSHTWAFMEKDGLVGIGIDDFLQHVTGPITRIKMKEPGEKVQKGEPFLTIIQDGKQLNLKSPISGTIKSQNKNLTSNASLINQSPYNEGWVYIIEPTNWLRDTQFLIFANGYKEWLKMEFLHLKDFLAVALRTSTTELVLQDGGEIKDGILQDLKPELWEDFQTHFIDSSL